MAARLTRSSSSRTWSAYADARNVTIIPEFEIPGHAAAMNRAMHDLFIIRGHQALRASRLDQLLSRTRCCGRSRRSWARCARSSDRRPYFHIGGDEADLALAAQNVDFKAAMKKYNLPNQHELYRRFVGQMDEIVKRHGKQMIVWEGFGRHGRRADPQRHPRHGLRDPFLHAPGPRRGRLPGHQRLVDSSLRGQQQLPPARGDLRLEPRPIQALRRKAGR